MQSSAHIAYLSGLGHWTNRNFSVNSISKRKFTQSERFDFIRFIYIYLIDAKVTIIMCIFFLHEFHSALQLLAFNVFSFA